MTPDTAAIQVAPEALTTGIQTSTITNGNYHWHIDSLGHAEPVCFLLHGTGASSHSWHPLMHALADAYTVIAIDLPGHANTTCQTKADMSLLGMAKAVKQLLTQLKVNPDVIVGHSAGAAIAAQMVINQPGLCHRLVSINGALVPLGGLPGLIFPPAARISASFPLLTDLFTQRLRDPKAVDKLLKNTGSRVSQASTRQYHELCNNKAHVNGALQMMANWRLDDLYRRLSSITIPVHLIAAANDAMIPTKDARRLSTLFQKSELTILPNLGHLAHEEQPHTVADIILKGDL